MCRSRTENLALGPVRGVRGGGGYGSASTPVLCIGMASNLILLSLVQTPRQLNFHKRHSVRFTF